MRGAINRTIGRCSTITRSCSAVRRSRCPEDATAADGSFGGLCSALPNKRGFVRQPIGADKSVCRGVQGSLAESLIFTPTVMRWPNRSMGNVPPSDPSEVVRGGYYRTGFIGTFTRNVNERKSGEFPQTQDPFCWPSHWPPFSRTLLGKSMT
jgi:hypothetical protein